MVTKFNLPESIRRIEGKKNLKQDYEIMLPEDYHLIALNDHFASLEYKTEIVAMYSQEGLKLGEIIMDAENHRLKRLKNLEDKR